jgi:Flp pilus assembly protein TadD
MYPMKIVALSIALLFPAFVNHSLIPFQSVAPSQQASSNAEEHFLSGLKFKQARQWAQAEAEFRKAAEVSPSDARFLYHLADVLLHLKQLEEAETTIKRAIEIDPYNPEYQAELGYVYNNYRDYAAAERQFERAVSLKPTENDYHFILGFAIGMQGKDAAAEAAYKRALKYFPRDSHFTESLGSVLVAQGKYEEAEGIFQKAIALDPADGLNHFYLAFSLHKQGKYVEAEKEYKEAIRLYPGSPRYYLGLLATLSRQKKLVEANHVYEEAIAKNVKVFSEERRSQSAELFYIYRKLWQVSDDPWVLYYSGDAKQWDGLGNLNYFAAELQNNPDDLGYILVYSGEDSCFGDAQAHAVRLKNYLMRVRGLSWDKVMWRDAGRYTGQGLRTYLLRVPRRKLASIFFPYEPRAGREVNTDCSRRKLRRT